MMEEVPNKARSSAQTAVRLLWIAIGSAVLVAAVEALESLLSTRSPGWPAHLLTVVLVALAIAVAGYLVLRRIEALDRQLRLELGERIVAAEALRESEERYRAFSELASDYVYQKRAESVPQERMDSAALRLCGLEIDLQALS